LLLGAVILLLQGLRQTVSCRTTNDLKTASIPILAAACV